MSLLLNIVVVEILPLLEKPRVMSRATFNSARGSVISVVDDHFGTGHCFQLFPFLFAAAELPACSRNSYLQGI